ncbi:MAG: hypothetical protein LBG26_07930 [Treponema sp.]|jgi:tRNA uridine 5-carbamoylmethylation protein Kti12|nr:hypothetical protein [Treponema sp.]
MKIVLLSGKPGSGKTTTLNDVYNELVDDDKDRIDCPKAQVGANPLDFECVVTFHEKKIALFTAGDYLWQCVESIIKYAWVDVLIQAYSDRFSTELNTIIGRYDCHVVVDKTASNDDDCKKIIGHL